MEFTIRQLAEQVLAMTGSKSELTFLPLPTDDPRQRQPNIDLARSRLGWSPAVQLEQGLQATIEYFASRHVACPGRFGPAVHQVP